MERMKEQNRVQNKWRKTKRAIKLKAYLWVLMEISTLDASLSLICLFCLETFLILWIFALNIHYKFQYFVQVAIYGCPWICHFFPIRAICAVSSNTAAPANPHTHTQNNKTNRPSSVYHLLPHRIQFRRDAK